MVNLGMLNFVKHIDKGGFGSVDLVVDVNGNEFARKTFSPALNTDPIILDNVKKRFVKEIRIQEGINHPNIVPVLGKDLNVNPPFYLMPYAVGSLSADIKIGAYIRV